MTLGRSPLVYRVAFSTPWFEVEESIPESPDDLPYFRLTGANGVICLPMTKDGDLLLVRQFRPNLGKETLEFPAGGIDGDETVEQASDRELMEETGFRAGIVHALGTGRLHLNRTTHVEHFLLALEVRADPTLMPENGIAPLVVSRKDFIEMVKTDQIEQVAALSFFGFASVKLGVDLLRDPIDLIRTRVLEARQGETSE